MESAINFARQMLSVKKEIADLIQPPNSNVYASYKSTEGDEETYEFELNIVEHFDLDDGGKGCMLRVHRDTGEIQARKRIADFSDEGFAFWVLWGCLRNPDASEIETDDKALGLLLEMFPDMNRKEVLPELYMEYSSVLATQRPLSSKNFQRSADFSNKIMSKL